MVAGKENAGPGAGVEAIGVGVATAITSIIISKLAGKMADAVVGDSGKDAEEMYHRLHSNVSHSSFHIPHTQPETKQKAVPRRVPSRRAALVDSQPTMKYIEGALEQLKEAKGSTRCGICLKKLDEAIKAVKAEAEVIKVSEAKYQILQKLKDAGKIPKTVMWHQLSSKQRAFIDKVAERGA